MYTTDQADDQASMIRYIVKNPDKTVLDRETRLFQPNLFRLTDDNDAHKVPQVNKTFEKILNYNLYFTTYRDTIAIKNKITNNSACFLHANGPPNHYLDYLENNYIEPIRTADTRFFKDVFPIIEVITLPSRKEHVENLIKAYKIHAKIFDAVIGKDLDKDHPAFEQKKLSDGERGCALSHLTILEKYKQSKAPWVVILEDDFCVSNQFPGQWIGTIMIYFLEKLLSSGKDWDIFYLGRCYDSYSTAEFPCDNSQLIIKTKNPLCTHAYIVNTKSIPKLLKELVPLSLAIDLEYIDLIKNKKIEQFSSNPPLFFQGGFDTSIIKRGDTVVEKMRFLPVYSDSRDVYLEKININPDNRQTLVILTIIFAIITILSVVLFKNRWIRLCIFSSFIITVFIMCFFLQNKR